MGFQYSRTDSLLFTYHQGTNTAYLLLYVDDIILTASFTTLLHFIITLLSHEFAITDVGVVNYFHGILATHTSHGLFLS